MSRRSRQAKMSSRIHGITRAVAIAAMLALSSCAFAQSDDTDLEMRIQRLESGNSPARTRNQYRNRQPEDGQALGRRRRARPGPGSPAPAQRRGALPVQPNPPLRQPQPVTTSRLPRRRRSSGNATGAGYAAVAMR
jgi:hypothetical protein